MSEFTIVDVFAEERYAGNQPAVVESADGISGEEMQAIAREFNFSETTFVVGREGAAHRVRIYTPTAELPFAGHPTLGTAAVLREREGGDQIELALGIGRVPVHFDGEGDLAVAWMTPRPPELGPAIEPALIARAIGLEAGDLSHEFPVRLASVGITFAMTPIASAEALERAALDLNVFRDEVVAELGPTGIYAFARGGRPGADVTSRMFFDASGVREDPATGSACVCLGGYALEHAYLGRGRDASSIEAVVEQGHAVGRPSVLRLRAVRDGDGDRVSVGGRTVMIARGTLVS
jgi:trans-2,3-dihydro-3-hydroxyanthranilate isomerase